MSNTSLFIPCIESKYSAEYIANTLWNQKLAQVSSIVLVPIVISDFTYQKAYIKIERWYDSEIAYNFINRLNKQSIETRIVHRDDDWWPVEMLKSNIIFDSHYDNITTFNQEYFVKNKIFEEQKDSTKEDEAKEEEKKEDIIIEIMDYYQNAEQIKWSDIDNQKLTINTNKLSYVFIILAVCVFII
jgi:hypothetical protein